MKKFNQKISLKNFGIAMLVVVISNISIVGSIFGSTEEGNVVLSQDSGQMCTFQEVMTMDGQTWFFLKKSENRKILFAGILTDDGVCHVSIIDYMWLPREVVVDSKRYSIKISKKFILKDFDFEIENSNFEIVNADSVSKPSISITSKKMRIYVGKELREYKIVN